jgi:aspartate beta-hydroxylase
LKQNAKRMTDAVSALVRQAEAAADAGRWGEAEAIWTEVRRRDPANGRAAFSLGIHALQRGDARTAVSLLEKAQAAFPNDPFTLLTLSKARADAGDVAGETQAIDAALAVDPYFVPALLAKAQRFQRLGAAPTAAMFYRAALRSAPPEPHWPELLRAQLTHARDAYDRHAKALSAHLGAALAPAIETMAPEKAARWREAASVMAGLTEPYVQQANQLYVPRLPAIPFYDRALFPWAAALEAKTAIIREELRAALEADGEFAPYIQLRPDQPIDQWAHLNHSARWRHYSLWRNGAADERRLARCPETRKALAAVDMADIEGLCPNAMFSALAPRSHIPPHTGETNARLVVHLPLIVPEDCRYRVGFDQRQWREGEILVFDDTIEHEAHNDSDDLRVVLIFDVWNPLLSHEERDAVRRLASAGRAFAANPGETK